MMKKTFRHAAAQGFTLIELLIVVIIIAILAAIAIPQFANTGGDAQESALSANLNTVRSAVELYRVQHAGVYPSAVTAIPANAAACTAAGGVAGTGAINTAQAFSDQLTNFSDSTGGTCTVAAPAGGFILGPYLRAIPAESITNPPSTALVIANAAVYAAPAGVQPGWIFFNNANVGRFVVNSNANGRRNIPLHQY